MKPAFATSTAPGGIAGNEIGNLNCASKSPTLSSDPPDSGSSGDGDNDVVPTRLMYVPGAECHVLYSVGIREAFDLESR